MKLGYLWKKGKISTKDQVKDTHSCKIWRNARDKQLPGESHGNRLGYVREKMIDLT